MKFKKFEKKSDSSPQQSNDYLKIKPGEKVVGVLRGELYQFYSLWPDGGQKQELEKWQQGATLRFKANFVVFQDGHFVPKIWEFGKLNNNLLADIAQAMDITKTKIQISRTGSGKEDTRYTVLPLGQVDQKALDGINAVKLHILGPKPETRQPVPDESDIFFDDPPMPDTEYPDEELPF